MPSATLAEATGNGLYSGMTATDDTDELTKLHPNHVTVTRIVAAIWTAIVSAPLLAIETGQYFGAGELPVPQGAMAAAVAVLFIILVGILPRRRYNHRGYDIGEDRLRIVRGYLFRSDTIIPFGRIQHIDVDQGPLQRGYRLATLTVHTAGNHNSSVHLPGLLHDDAIAMREAIRAHIKRDTL